jgi:hypothetical protein
MTTELVCSRCFGRIRKRELPHSDYPFCDMYCEDCKMPCTSQMIPITPNVHRSTIIHIIKLYQDANK